MILARNSRNLYYVIPSPFVGSLYGILEFVLYFRFWGLGGIFSLRNSRALVIASEAKQSLEILNLSLRNSRIPYYAIPQPLWGIFLNTVALKPLAYSTCSITSKLEFVAGFVITPSFGRCLLGLYSLSSVDFTSR